MPITIRPAGGLGNQLFIYATGSTIAQNLGVELFADIRHFDSNPSRSYMLNRFPSQVARIIDDENAPKSNAHQKIFRGRFRKMIKNPREKVLGERGFWFDPNLLKAIDGTTITGHLQSWKYFHADSERLRREILNPLEPSQWFVDKREELASSDSWIGVHVRRGDYVEIPRMGLASDFYYSRGLAIVDKLSEKTRTIVFSDDTAAARELPSLKNRKNTEFLEAPPDSCPLENLVLMSLSSHLVGANSSFSWWAGWLNDQDGRIVTYPRPWIDFRFINDRDLPLPNWIGLGRESLDSALENHVGY